MFASNIEPLVFKELAYSVVDKFSCSVLLPPFVLDCLPFRLTACECLKRQLSLPVSTMWQWCVSRSSNAVVIFGSMKTEAHSAKTRMVVMTTLVCS